MPLSKKRRSMAEWGKSDKSAPEYQESLAPDPSSEDGSKVESEDEFQLLDLDKIENFKNPCKTTSEELTFLAEGMPDDKEAGKVDETSRAFDFSNYKKDGLHDSNIESVEYYRQDIDENNYKRRPYTPGTVNQINYTEYQ